MVKYGTSRDESHLLDTKLTWLSLKTTLSGEPEAGGAWPDMLCRCSTAYCED